MDGTMEAIGDKIYELVEKIYPICRSITGNGVRETLGIIRSHVPELTIHEVPSGTEVFDWTIPKEWNIKDAYIEDELGNRRIDFKENNLHIMGYSTPVNEWMNWEDLESHIYTIPNHPDWIPYVTSYYKERFGFCMTENQKQLLAGGRYHVIIDSELKDGSLTYGEVLLKGKSDKEIFITTYTCHPSLANNECSGPALATFIIQFIKSIPNRNYSYRILFGPETIGALAYLHENLDQLKQNVIAGFNLSCVGDERTYSMVQSRYGNTLADKVLRNVLHFHYPEFNERSYYYRGSDERQYCAPGVDLPYAVFCRSKFGEFPEYHTSADNLSLVTPEGLQGSYEVLCKCIMALEYNHHYQTTCIGEPQLGKRGLYPTLSRIETMTYDVWQMRNLIAYADGTMDLIDISNLNNYPTELLIPMIDRLMEEGLLKIVSYTH